MYKAVKIALKVLHKGCSIIRDNDPYLHPEDVPYDADATSSIIRQLIDSKAPCMIARFGAFELSLISNYLGVKNHSVYHYILDRHGPLWWDSSILSYMQSNAGFFPATIENAERFCKLMLEDTSHLDLLAEWKSCYKVIEHYLPVSAKVSHLVCVEPFFAEHPWTKALEGKKVLVVHPFDELIRSQYYDKRKSLFTNPDMLPDFELITLKAIQSIGGVDNGFKDWFEALEWMKQEIDSIDYDVCLLGCGAYGFPLAAHCKLRGKQAIHLGGSLQLLFGIIGNRWADPMYGVKEWGIAKEQYSSMINNHWVRPGQKERPKNAQQVEGACYW